MTKKAASSTQKKSEKALQVNRASSRKYRRNRWWYRLIESARSRKISANIPNKGITRELIEKMWEDQEGLCFWTRVPLLKNSEFKRHPQLASLDRIDTKKGYTPDNVVLSSLFANFGKSSTSIKVWFSFLQVLRDTLNPLCGTQPSTNVQLVLPQSPTQPPHPNTTTGELGEAAHE